MATPEEKWRAREPGGMSLRLKVACRAAVPLVADGSKENIVVKSVHAPLALEWIRQRFNPEVLVVRRHPYNVLASRLELGFKPGPRDVRSSGEFARKAWDVEPVAPDDPPLLQEAFHLGVLLLALNDAVDRHPEWQVVRHEELCAEPVVGLSDVAARLGLEWTAQAEAFVRESNKSGTGYATNRIAEEQPERWRRRLKPEQLSTIDSALARLPERLRSTL
jgi:hypothetical protein